VRAHRAVATPYLDLILVSQEGVIVYQENNVTLPYPALRPGESAELTVKLPLRLATGHFQLSYAVARGNEGPATGLDLAQNTARLSVEKRLPIYVRGRQTALGLADLAAEFGK
jgi:hypothetical protein